MFSVCKQNIYNNNIGFPVQISCEQYHTRPIIIPPRRLVMLIWSKCYETSFSLSTIWNTFALSNESPFDLSHKTRQLSCLTFHDISDPQDLHGEQYCDIKLIIKLNLIISICLIHAKYSQTLERYSLFALVKIQPNPLFVGHQTVVVLLNSISKVIETI